MWWEDRSLDALDTFMLGPLVALPSALLEGSWQAGLRNGLDALLGMGGIFIVVALGLGEIGDHRRPRAVSTTHNRVVWPSPPRSPLRPRRPWPSHRWQARRR